MQQAHVYISGFVQGVGFRHFVKYSARKLGLLGWIRNLPDGRVEAVFQVSKGKERIEKMIELCKKGPLISEVENVEVLWEEGTEKFNSFETR